MITIKLETEIELGTFYNENLITDLITCESLVEKSELFECKNVIIDFPFPVIKLDELYKYTAITDYSIVTCKMFPVKIPKITVSGVKILYHVESDLNLQFYDSYEEIKKTVEIFNGRVIDSVASKLQENYNKLKLEQFAIDYLYNHREEYLKELVTKDLSPNKIDSMPKEDAENFAKMAIKNNFWQIIGDMIKKVLK